MKKTQTINWCPLSEKHINYIRNALNNKLNVAEGAIRSGKTIDHNIIAAMYLETCPDKIHLASGSFLQNAKLNIGACNGFGLENLFRGRCRWGKYKDNDALYIDTQTGEKIVIFAGGGKSDSYKRILGNSYGLWIATEINEHYDSDDSRESFIKVAFGRQAAAIKPLTLWDLNPCRPNHRIYTEYIDKWQGNYAGGYQYEHFTIEDNLSVTPKRLAEIKANYDEDSIWYQRDILGKRVSPEGAVFPCLVEHPERFMVKAESVSPRFKWVDIGFDIGGNSAAYAMTCSALGMDNILYVLKSKKLQAQDVPISEVKEFAFRFIDDIENRYHVRVDSVNTDHSDVVINTLNEIRYIFCKTYKPPLTDRPRMANILLSSGKMKFVDGETDDLIEEWQDCVYDDYDCILDDGSMQIDTSDSAFYSLAGHWAYITDIVKGGI